VSQVTLARNRSLHFLDNHSGHNCGHSATRVLHLEPVGRAAAAIWRVLPLAHNAFKPELAGVAENLGAVALDVVIEPNAMTNPGQDGGQRGLADFERLAAEIVAVELNQIEGVQEHAAIMAPISNVIEARCATLIAGGGLSIDDAGARAQPSQGLHDQRKTICQVVARPAVEPHLGAVLPGDDPKSVMLDFMQPLAA
jgi:hypothetical protein